MKPKSILVVMILFSTGYAEADTRTTLDKPGANHTHILGIDGSNFVGMYYDGSGGWHGFVYEIPEPAMLRLQALGGLALMRRK